MQQADFKLIQVLDHQERVADLISQLNPNMAKEEIISTIQSMAALPNYICFGLFEHKELIGVSSGWTTIRFYCGKQLEVDNVIIDSGSQSKGLGAYFMDKIENWAVDNAYRSIGLNTYVQNHRSHKFYFNQGFKVLGFHFEKEII